MAVGHPLKIVALEFDDVGPIAARLVSCFHLDFEPWIRSHRHFLAAEPERHLICPTSVESVSSTPYSGESGGVDDHRGATPALIIPLS